MNKDVEYVDIFFFLLYSEMSFCDPTMHYSIHAKNVWCCGEGYFGQTKFAEKVRKSRQNVNRDKSA